MKYFLEYNKFQNQLHNAQYAVQNEQRRGKDKLLNLIFNILLIFHVSFKFLSVMRLRCRFRPLHDFYMQNGEICDQDTDVVFICIDGRVRAHKIILSTASNFFATILEDQVKYILNYNL